MIKRSCIRCNIHSRRIFRSLSFEDGSRVDFRRLLLYLKVQKMGLSECLYRCISCRSCGCMHCCTRSVLLVCCVRNNFDLFEINIRTTEEYKTAKDALKCLHAKVKPHFSLLLLSIPHANSVTVITFALRNLRVSSGLYTCL